MRGRRLLVGVLGAPLLVAGLAGVAESASGDKGIFVTPAGSPYAVGMTPNKAVTADLDGDGDLDAATANQNGSTITVLRNDGSGVFTTASHEAGHPSDLAVANLNGDAFPDIVAVRSEPNCCGNTDSLLTLLGTGNAAFAPVVQLTAVAFNVGPLVVGDVNGDGVPDAIVTNTWVSPTDSEHFYQQFEVYLGNGSGGWVWQGQFVDEDSAIDQSPLSDGALVDVDNDGDLDLAFGDTRALRVTVWKNDGTGAFARTLVVPLARQTGDIVPHDFDGDGDVDLAVSGSNSGGIVMLLNDGTGNYSSASWSPIATGTLWPNSMAGADVNDDGNLDLVGAGINQDAFVVFLGDGTGHFVAGWGGSYPVENAKGLATGDLNGDGYDDVVVTSNSTDTAHIRLTLIDNDPPTTSLVLDPPAPPGSGWYNGPVTGQVTADDVGTGVSGVRCALDPVSVPATFDDLPGCPGQFEFSASGVHHVYSAARDLAGNLGPVVDDLVKIDVTDPVVSLPTTAPPNDAGWFGDPVLVTPEASDPHSGIATLRCVVDPVDSLPSFEQMPECASSYLLEHGTHHVYAVARDLAGNTSPVSLLTVKVDTDPPSIDVFAHPSTVVRGNPVETTWNASDRDSGIDHVDCLPVSTAQLGTTFANCAAYDRAGNVSNNLAQVNVIPADVSVRLVTAKANGTRLAVTARLDTDGLVDGANVVVETPPSLRVDVVPAGCLETATGMTCSLGSFANDRALVMLVTPASEGPHVIEMSVAVPDDPDPTNDTDDAGIGFRKVCDNVPTGGADTVTGTSAADILCGLGGADLFRGLGGNDLIFGGAGVDTVSYAGSAAAVRVDLRLQGLGQIGARPRSGTGHGSDSFTGIENALGTGLPDLITGNGVVNRLTGGAGNDVLTGLAGRDTLLGGTGTDTCREATDVRSSCERS